MLTYIYIKYIKYYIKFCNIKYARFNVYLRMLNIYFQELNKNFKDCSIISKSEYVKFEDNSLIGLKLFNIFCLS